MLVDEEEVPETVDISQRRVVADRMSLVGVGQAAQDMPRRGNGQKQQ